MKRIFNVGDRFGRLTITSLETIRKYHVICRCDCGTEKEIKKYGLGNGVYSCGCKSKEHMIKMNTKHGLVYHRLHSIWTNMKQRCSNPKTKNYKYYGGRGITFCEEWKDYKPFYDWAINNGYKDALTLDRTNVNGNYEPNNCEWATMREQHLNRRDSRKNKKDS